MSECSLNILSPRYLFVGNGTDGCGKSNTYDEPDTDLQCCTTGSSGEPELDDSPFANMNIADFEAILASIMGKVTDAQLITQQSIIEGDGVRQRALHDEVREALEKALKAMNKSKNLSFWEKLGNWLSKIANVVASAMAVAAAAAATAATGGAAAPLLAVATCMLVGSTIDLAGDISEELGGPSFSAASLIHGAFAKFGTEVLGMSKEDADKFANIAGMSCALISPELYAAGVAEIGMACGMSEKDAQILGMVVTTVAMVALFVATTVATGGVGAGAKIADMSKTAANLAKTAKAIEGAAMIASGAGQVVSGAVHAARTAYEYERSENEAAVLIFKAIIAQIQKDIEEHADNVKALYKQEEQLYETLGTSLENKGESVSNMIQMV